MLFAFFKALNTYAETKLSKFAQNPAFPVPKLRDNNNVNTNELSIRILCLCTAAKDKAKGQDFVFCHAIYLFCMFAATHNEFSEQEAKQLSDAMSKDTVLMLNTFFEKFKDLVPSYGILNQLGRIRTVTNIKTATADELGTKYDPKSDF